MKRTIISLVVGLIGVVLFAYGLGQTLKIGTCASGNTPYLIAHPCPAGTGTKIVLLGAGIILATAGMIIGAGRTMWLLFSAMFLAGGLAALLNSLTGPHAGPGVTTADYILAATFIPLGALPLLWLTGNGLGSLRARALRARSREAHATVARVEELQRFGRAQAKVRITYAVHPPDDVSFEVTRETNVLLTHAPAPGQRLRIRYDPSDHARFEPLAPAAPGAVPPPTAMVGAARAPGYLDS